MGATLALMNLTRNFSCLGERALATSGGLLDEPREPLINLPCCLGAQGTVTVYSCNAVCPQKPGGRNILLSDVEITGGMPWPDTGGGGVYTMSTYIDTWGAMIKPCFLSTRKLFIGRERIALLIHFVHIENLRQI